MKKVNWFLENPNLTLCFKIMFSLHPTKWLRFKHLVDTTQSDFEDISQSLAYLCHYEWVRGDNGWYRLTSLGRKKCFMDTI